MLRTSGQTAVAKSPSQDRPESGDEQWMTVSGGPLICHRVHGLPLSDIGGGQCFFFRMTKVDCNYVSLKADWVLLDCDRTLPVGVKESFLWVLARGLGIEASVDIGPAVPLP